MNQSRPAHNGCERLNTAVNAYVRTRDDKEPCISCGRYHEGQYHAGHYRSTGSSPALRFDLANIHKQCMPCNTHLHGNLIPYRVNLIQKIGLAEVERLEGPQEPKKYTIDELKDIISNLPRQNKGIEKWRLNDEDCRKTTADEADRAYLYFIANTVIETITLRRNAPSCEKFQQGNQLMNLASDLQKWHQELQNGD